MFCLIPPESWALRGSENKSRAPGALSSIRLVSPPPPAHPSGILRFVFFFFVFHDVFIEPESEFIQSETLLGVFTALLLFYPRGLPSCTELPSVVQVRYGIT